MSTLHAGDLPIKQTLLLLLAFFHWSLVVRVHTIATTPPQGQLPEKSWHGKLQMHIDLEQLSIFVGYFKNFILYKKISTVCFLMTHLRHTYQKLKTCHCKQI